MEALLWVSLMMSFVRSCLFALCSLMRRQKTIIFVVIHFKRLLVGGSFWMQIETWEPLFNTIKMTISKVHSSIWVQNYETTRQATPSQGHFKYKYWSITLIPNRIQNFETLWTLFDHMAELRKIFSKMISQQLGLPNFFMTLSCVENDGTLSKNTLLHSI